MCNIEVERLLKEAQEKIDQAKALIAQEYPSGRKANVFIQSGQVNPTLATLGAPYVREGFNRMYYGIRVSFYPKRVPRFGEPRRSYRSIPLDQVMEVL